MCSSENMSACDKTSTTLVLPFVWIEELAKGNHPGLLLDVNVKVITLDVWMGFEGLTTICLR